MTVLLLPEQWTWGGESLSTYAMVVTLVTGADEFPPLRGTDPPYTGLHGAQAMRKLWDERAVTLALYVSPQGDSGGVPSSNTVQARANLDALYAMLGVRGRALLGRTMPDGSIRQALAECVNVNAFQDPVAHETFALAADFLLADPLWYAASALAPALAIGHTTVTNPGTVKTHKLVLDITGPLANAELLNHTNGVYLQALVTVASGKHLIVDCGAFTAANDGVNAIGSIRHAGALSFLELEPGANDLELTGTGTPTAVSLTYTPAFL